MSEVSLQAYGAEMRQLVAEGAHEEALAIGRHLLEIYPKHWQTYRLMGEACLEKGDYEEAHQLFARALACDPEDLFSRVGISVAHRKRGDLSLAIWHMERAYELSPGNAELRRELQELYAERDGTSRPRLKFTSGAVARLYARSYLWTQALHEFRALLRQNPDLVDVKIALAQALWNVGSKKEAAQLCQEILETYPHCLKANLILGEIWLHGEREMEGRALLQLAQDIDPENAVAQTVFGERSPLPARVVKVSRLEDAPIPEMVGEMEGEPEAAAEEEVLLPWLSSEEEAAPMEEEEIFVEEPFAEAEIGEPEGAFEEAMPTEEAEEELPVMEELAAVEEALEPEEVFPEEERPTEEEGEEEGIPDWLQRIRERHKEGDEAAEPEAAAEAEEMPEAEEAPAAEIPDWLKQLEMEAETQAEAEEEAEIEPLPDWLLEEEEAAPQEEVAEEELRAEGVDVELEALLAREMEEPAAEETAIAEEALIEAISAEEEEVPVEAPAAEEAAIEAEEAEVPDWMKRLGEEVREQAAAAEAEEAPEVESEAPPVPEITVEEEAPVEAEEAEVPDWMKRLGEEVREQAAAAEAEEAPEVEVEAPPAQEIEPEMETPVEAEEAEVPDWMKRLGEEVREQAAAAEAEETPVEAPVAEEEVAPAEVEAPPTPEVAVEAPVAEEEVAEAVFELEEIPVPAPAAADGEETLARARELRDSGDADGALDLYEQLIRQEQLLSSVLADLEGGTSGPLAQSRTFTLIGDLCTKQGRLQRALEAYRQALDMLKQ